MATENFDRLHERVLQFVGAFTQAQFSMDYAIDRYLAGKMPRVGPAITAQFLGRVRDDQRLVLFMSVAAEVESAADVSNVEYIFNRAKQCRDTVAHAAGVIGPVTRKDAPPYVALASFSSPGGKTTKRPLVPATLVPSTFDGLTNDCEWLSDMALFLGQSAGVMNVMSFSGKPLQLRVPPTLPIDGLPLL